ncbi:MAG: flagellar hook-associated protein FlgK [Arcobacter sp.]|jgi:flagellar hook-associated protein 1 FlgK|uniref:flagellar hook-associated protein FlgK n=1 Tax=Arcobacter sp. TaxID=1872629 RepID=UPI00258C1F77|nr:flagellar hook-associated protein FlgK [Arcobacter sp.]MDD3007667.1 flagellar hook-associated protein FlgK [Arcobacter sp.]MDY3203958.1 flagellar hook-associated protein FlgK [Arcobacter sp.]
MLSTLNVSYTGLSAAKTAVENVSNNIANENAPGYKKRVVGLSELGQMDSLFAGRGVSVDGIYRVTSQYMFDKVINENSKSNYYDKLSGMLGNVESVFKETEESGFSVDLNRYFQSIENLRTNPNSEIYKSALKNEGGILVETLQNIYSTIQKQQDAEKTELNANVEKINSLLKEIGDVNDKIVKYATATNDLYDKRDQLELELSNYVDITVNRDEDFYELKIGDSVAISNNTIVKTVDVISNDSSQIDKFNHINYDSVTNTFTTYDSLKYNEDLTSKNLDLNDVVTYKLNNEFEVSVTIGESITMDWDGDGTETTEIVDDTNLTRAIVHKINSNPDFNDLVVAYNGDYSIDSNGNKVTNDSKDNYLRVESKFPGIDNSFDARVSIVKKDNTDSTIIDSRESLYKNEDESKTAISDVSIGIYGREVSLKTGIVKAQVDNLSTSSVNNKFQTYFDKLDAFAQTLADITDKYIKTGTDSYIYGEAASDDEDSGVINSLGLFSGSSVMTLKFNKNAVNDLKQLELDYLATIQWKTDLSFEGKGQGVNSSNDTSLLEFYRELRVSVSADKENSNFLLETQDSITQSVKSSYDNLVKVDKDDEMLDLMKFQAAYTANAKIVTAIDEMLQILLGLKR